MRSLLLIVAVSILAGCAGLGGYVSRTTSEFDGTTQITSSPGWVGGGVPVKLSLLWNSKMPPNKAIMTVDVENSQNIASGESLHFNVDGTVVNLASIDSSSNFWVEAGHSTSVAYIPSKGWASKRYIVDIDLISKITKSNKTMIKLDLDRKYIEGTLLDQPTIALSGFKDFMIEINKPFLK